MTSTSRNLNRWRAFALLAVAFFMTIVDLTIVNVSLPTIGRDLGFSPTDLQWVATAYALTFGGFLLLGGRAEPHPGRPPFRRGHPTVERIDLAELSSASLALVAGGTAGWRAKGQPVVASPGEPPDSERIDYLFWNHDRHSGNEAAMRAYLRWETELPPQFAAEGNTGFRLTAAG